MSVSRGTVHSIQFFRFVAAALVVLLHATRGYLSIVPVAAASRATAFYWAGFGAVGVHIFFVISGVIMYLTSFGRDRSLDARTFFGRRLIRIFPSYWFFLAAQSAVMAFAGILPRLDHWQILGMILLWPGQESWVIAQVWTLPFELYFYLVFGLMLGLGERRATIAVSVWFAVAAMIGVIWRPQGFVSAVLTNTLLLEFVAGLWIARMTLRRHIPPHFGWLAIVAALLCFAGGLAWGYTRLPSLVMWGGPSALLILGGLILERIRPLSPGSPVRRFGTLGDSSYTLYLGHSLLIMLGMLLLGRSGSLPLAIAAIALTVPVCVVAAHLFHAAIERPAMGALQRRLGLSRPLA